MGKKTKIVIGLDVQADGFAMTAIPVKRRYAEATWCGLTRTCSDCGVRMLTLDVVDGPHGTRADLIAQLQAGGPMRLIVSRETSGHLVNVLAPDEPGYGLCPLCRSQSESSSGRPMADVSILPTVPNV